VLSAALPFDPAGREVIGYRLNQPRRLTPDRELLVVLANIGSHDWAKFTERKALNRLCGQSEAYLAEAQRLTAHEGVWVYDHLLGR